MNYTETYQLFYRALGSEQEELLDSFDTETEAAARMDFDQLGATGSWRIERVMSVTVRTISKSKP